MGLQGMQHAAMHNMVHMAMRVMHTFQHVHTLCSLRLVVGCSQVEACKGQQPHSCCRARDDEWTEM